MKPLGPLKKLSVTFNNKNTNEICGSQPSTENNNWRHSFCSCLHTYEFM